MSRLSIREARGDLSNIARGDWLRIVIVVAFFIGIILANKLWISDRGYPLSPVLGAFSSLPRSLDYLLAPALLITLASGAFSKNFVRWMWASIALAVFLILEDRGRLFPSFYEYLVILFILAISHGKNAEQGREKRDGLNAARLGVAFIYLWSGIQKMNPFFGGQLSWVMLPILNVFPALRGGPIQAATVLIPVLEAGIGIELLFKKTRNAGLIEAVLMHGALVLLIGPARSVWNVGAWAWNFASMIIVFVLFYKTDDVGVWEIVLPEKKSLAYASSIFFFGFLPALNFVNLWGAGPSFNVYSGNVTRAELYVSASLAAKLPIDTQKFIVGPGDASDGKYFLDMSAWSENEVHAEPDPETPVFRNIARSICAYADAPSDVELVVHDKLMIFQQANLFSGVHKYDCSLLLQ